jgi:hypothetical protein
MGAQQSIIDHGAAEEQAAGDAPGFATAFLSTLARCPVPAPCRAALDPSFHDVQSTRRMSGELHHVETQLDGEGDSMV